MFKPFSKRGKPEPAELTGEVLPDVRNRLYHQLSEVINRREGWMDKCFEDAANEGLKAYGGLHASPLATTLLGAAKEHYSQCQDERFIDFLEWIFRSDGYRSSQFGVDIVNSVFREEGIGYEFSPYVVTTTQLGGGSVRCEITYPEATVKTNQLLHSTTVMPALQLLSDKKWHAANIEMLKAHEHLRHGNVEDAILWAGKCLESVLKLICDTKGWPLKPDKDTLGVLLQTCFSHGLFPEPYVRVFSGSSGEIRNKFSGHGSAKSPHGDATFEMAEHMIQITSAHVVLLATMAGHVNPPAQAAAMRLRAEGIPTDSSKIERFVSWAVNVSHGRLSLTTVQIFRSLPIAYGHIRMAVITVHP